MSLTADALAPAGPRLIDPIGAVLEDLAGRLRGTCLLESRDGDIISHALIGQPTDAVASAVLERSSTPLHVAARRRRTAAVLTGGALVSLTLPGRQGLVWVTPVVAAGVLLGWLWVLAPQGAVPEVEALAQAADDVARSACGLLMPEDRELLDALFTSNVKAPRALLGRPIGRLWVAALAADGEPARTVAGAADLALPVESSEQMIAVAVADDLVYLVVSTTSTATAADVQQTVEALLAKAPGLRISGALSGPVAAVEDLPSARAQADCAIGVSTPGRCVGFPQVRPRVVLDRLCDALAALTELGPDPVLPLLEYDAKRGSNFARTLLAWMECSGDAVRASELLGVPQNTLRYRVARAKQVLRVDLSVPSARIEIQLRLRTALHGPVTAGSDPTSVADGHEGSRHETVC